MTLYSSNPWSKLISCATCGAVIGTTSDNPQPPHNQGLHTQWHEQLEARIVNAESRRLPPASELKVEMTND